MKAFYYYDRDENNRPVTTHCFVTNGVKHARGTAYCSENDNPCKAEGRRLAYKRAMQAFHRGRSDWSPDFKFQVADCFPAVNRIETKFVRAIGAGEG